MKHTIRQDLNFAPAVMRDVTVHVDSVGGVNLGQGHCLLEPPSEVLEGAHKAMQAGENRCPAIDGVAPLREQVLKKIAKWNNIPLEPQNLLITAGATGGLETICQTLLEPGDEVIYFSPIYPYHKSVLDRSRIKIRYIDLVPPTWDFDLNKIEDAISPRTKFMLVNTPHNPTGKVFTREELEALGNLCKKHNIFCVTDEVYELMTFDGREHISLASLPGMFDHCITLGSFSKTYAITGWRVGYTIAPDSIVNCLRPMSDFIYLGSPTPLQHGVAYALENLSEQYYTDLKQSYDHKRTLLMEALDVGDIPYFPTQGAYYVVADTRERFPGVPSEDVVREMVDKVGVASVPAIDFLPPGAAGDATKSNFLRVCFAVPDHMIEDAAERLRGMSAVKAA